MHRCDPARTTSGPANLAVCAQCGHYEWTDRFGTPMDPSDGIAAAYGPFVLISRLDSIGAPGGSALVYRVPSRHRHRLDAFVAGEWTQIHPSLYGSQDGTNLLLAPIDPTVSHRLGIAG